MIEPAIMSYVSKSQHARFGQLSLAAAATIVVAVAVAAATIRNLESSFRPSVACRLRGPKKNPKLNLIEFS